MTVVNKFIGLRDNKQNDEAAELCHPDIVWDFKGDKVDGIEKLREQWKKMDSNGPPPITWKEFTKEGNVVQRDGQIKKGFMTFNVMQKIVVEEGKLKSGFMGKK